MPVPPAFPIPGGHDFAHIPVPGTHGDHGSRGPEVSPGAPSAQFPSPASHSGTPVGIQQAPPPSGFRIPLTDGSPFPSFAQSGEPVALDADGHTPVYMGSALFGNAVHPCKIVPDFTPPVRVSYGGEEREHRGRYDLLPFDSNTMEWVRTFSGVIPSGRRPVEGGYEETGGKLFHALATVNGVRVPGKTGEHLGGANVPFGGQEHVVTDDYSIL
ncbi:hypothetical protein C8Q79DRAFT_998961 [Trametes meyenii]|nr:hypothetical protein C8Q79DRAFT_998961 [Trametes meyenii]